MVRAVLFALTLFPAGVAAQGHPLVGSWQVSFVGGMRIENGEPTPIKRTGKLSVETTGDSLIATLTTDPTPGLPARPAARLAAKAGPGKTSFLLRSKVTVNTNGTEQEATAVSTWILDAKGDQLEGSVDRKVEGVDAPHPGPQPITGTRIQN